MINAIERLNKSQDKPFGAGNAKEHQHSDNPELVSVVFINEASEEETVKITAKERLCASLLAKGYSNKKIAASMGINYRTVENHLGNLRGKLRLRNRIELAVWMLKYFPH